MRYRPAVSPRNPSPNHGSATTGHLALVAVQVIFGLFPVLGLLAMDREVGFDPLVVAAWRVGGASLILGVMARLRHPGALTEGHSSPQPIVATTSYSTSGISWSPFDRCDVRS